MKPFKVENNHIFRGITFDDIATEVLQFAKEADCNVEYIFSKVVLTATPKSTIKELWDQFTTKLDERNKQENFRSRN